MAFMRFLDALNGLQNHLGMRAPALAALPLVVCLLAGPGLAQSSERPTIYKWVDENGIPHYTTERSRIPREVRGMIRDPHKERPAEPVAPAAPPPEADPWAAISPPPPPEPDPWATFDRDPSSVWAVSDAEPDSVLEDTFDVDDYASDTPGRDPHLQAAVRELDTQIATLEVKIRRDEDRLKDWLDDPNIPADDVADDPEFREIAARLPEWHEEMRELLEKRQSYEAGASTP
jgi:hypothetical protein